MAPRGTCALLGVALLAAGCATGRTPDGHGPTSPAPPAAAAAPSPLPPPPGPEVLDRQALAARYLTVAEAGNRRLERDFDRLEGPDRASLRSAERDLRDAAAAERRFDRQLARIPLPADLAPVARQLIAANEARARLTERAARAPSLPRLHRAELRLDAADRTVEVPVRILRAELGLPPPPPP